MASDKYKELRNLIFNELGITKDDIRQWTKEAAMEAAERRARSLDIEDIVKENIVKIVRDIIQPRYGNPSREVKDQIAKAIAEVLEGKISITIK